MDGIEIPIRTYQDAAKYSRGRLALPAMLAEFERAASSPAPNPTGPSMGADSNSRLAALTLKLHRAVLDFRSNGVLLHAEAQTELVDDTVRPGLRVSFFLNGEQFRDVETDDFGRAELRDVVATSLLLPRQNHLAARVKGSARHATAEFTILNSFSLSGVDLKVVHAEFVGGVQKVSLRVRATARLHASEVSDNSDVTIDFCMNGKAMHSVKTDALGCAVLDHVVATERGRGINDWFITSGIEEWQPDCWRFMKNTAYNVLAARVAGFPFEVAVCFYWDGGRMFEVKE